MTMSVADRLIDYLWPDGDLPTTPQVYALLDGARDRRIEPMIRLSGLEYTCLYGGRLSPPLERAAPYLVHLTPRSSFTSDFLSLGWGRSWGILTVVPPDCTMQQQRRHFRTILRVKTEDSRTLVFRFYDPRVLRIYLPTCMARETEQVFGPIPKIGIESEDGDALLVYSPDRDGPSLQTVPLVAQTSREPLRSDVARDDAALS